MKKLIIGIIVAVVLAGLLPNIGGLASGASTDRATTVHIDNLGGQTVYAKDLVTGYIYPAPDDNDSMGAISIGVDVSDDWSTTSTEAAQETWVIIHVGNDTAPESFYYAASMAMMGGMYKSGDRYKGSWDLNIAAEGLYFNWGLTYFNITVLYMNGMMIPVYSTNTNDTVLLENIPDRVSHGIFSINMNGPGGWLLTAQTYPSDYEEVRIREGDRATSISLNYWVDGQTNTTAQYVAAMVRTALEIQKDNETVFIQNWTANAWDLGYLPDLNDPSLPWVTAWSGSTGRTFSYDFTDGYYELKAYVMIKNATTGNYTQVAWSNHTVNLVIPPTVVIDDSFSMITPALGFCGIVGMVVTPATASYLYRRGTDPIKVAVVLMAGMVGFGVLIWLGLLGGGTI